MLVDVESVRIPYDEYRAINSLLEAHLATHERQLRAMVVFGPLITRGGTYDIDIMEVVAGWDGPPSVSFTSTVSLPLRGLLRLNLLTPEQISDPNQAVRDILVRVRLGYQVIYEEPHGYVDRVLMGASVDLSSDDPLTFLDRNLSGQTA